MVRGSKTSLSPDSLDYLADLAPQDDVLARIERETSEMPRSMMQMSPDQGALMQVLVAATDATNALEVGTFTGYSAICIARGLGDRRAGSRAWSSRTSTRTSRSGTSRRRRGGPGRRSVRGPARRLAGCDARGADVRLRVPRRRQDRLSDDYYEQILPRMQPNALLLIDNVLMGGRRGRLRERGLVLTPWSTSSTRGSRRTSASRSRSRWSPTGSRSSASVDRSCSG